MSPDTAGQRCLSEREPELGLGIVASVDRGTKRIAVDFPATREKRLYALGTPVLKRVQFRPGETVATRDGTSFVIESADEENGILLYIGNGQRVREEAISDVTSIRLPQERLMAGQADPGEVFDLRLRTLQAQGRFRQSDVRGFLGGRLELIPHQLYIVQEVAARQLPRVLLADEVGLGKTIEACLILHRLLAMGQSRRVLILVPESLTHQWFVELLRRFNLWFSIYDEGRCLALEQSDPTQNPFLAAQLALCSVAFLADNPPRREQAVAAGWDILVVDEAHHLAWSPQGASPSYLMVEELAGRTPGLLLLTATPTQLGLAGHFARLRLLDPHRYANLDQFREESERFGTVAGIAERIIEGSVLTAADCSRLRELFAHDLKRLEQHLGALAAAQPGARAALLKTLLDQHGTGRVMFRNTRAAITGFPPRKFRPAPLSAANNLALLSRVGRELLAEETGQAPAIRYSFKDDPRIEWLANLLREQRREKILLICASTRKVLAIEAALKERINTKTALFHEGLPLVQRDRNAAWFAEPDGAHLLLCSEIGSEGRNFQFAHHLVLFDLPLAPGLIEQRIGRLDRIGQTQAILIHVPYLAGSSAEAVVEWYHRGLDAFETSLQGGDEYEEKFNARLLAVALDHGGVAEGKADPQLERLVAETAAFRRKLSEKMKAGRDRLLELHSFDRDVAEKIIDRIRAVDADPLLKNILGALLDHFGVRVKEHEEGDVFLDPSHAYIEGFPSIPAEGMLATFSRSRAIAREDIRFISPDHSLVRDAIDLLVDSQAGTTAFGFVRAAAPNLLLEAVFVLEAVADSCWHVDRYLAPTPVRVVTDLRGRDLTAGRAQADIAQAFEDCTVQRFLERPEFDLALLKNMLASASSHADRQATGLKTIAGARAETALSEQLQRLVDLRKINDHVRPEEIELAAEQRNRVTVAIAGARLRLDSIRLIVEGPTAIE